MLLSSGAKKLSTKVSRRLTLSIKTFDNVSIKDRNMIGTHELRPLEPFVPSSDWVGCDVGISWRSLNCAISSSAQSMLYKTQILYSDCINQHSQVDFLPFPLCHLINMKSPPQLTPFAAKLWIDLAQQRCVISRVN